MKLYVVEDTELPRIIWREARETAKMYVVKDYFGLRVPRGISFKNHIGKAEFQGAAGCGLTPIEATKSWVEYRKRRHQAAKEDVVLERAAVNAALKLRNDTEDRRGG